MPARRRIALLGVAVILFQAILFGWHHHALTFAGRGGPSLTSATQPLVPATAEDLCEICVVLHHQSASPLTVAAPPTPRSIGSAIDLPPPVYLARTGARGFHARAPPLRA